MRAWLGIQFSIRNYRLLCCTAPIPIGPGHFDAPPRETSLDVTGHDKTPHGQSIESRQRAGGAELLVCANPVKLGGAGIGGPFRRF